MTETITPRRLNVGQRVRVTASNVYTTEGRIKVGGLGTIIEVAQRKNSMFPYRVQYDEFEISPLWTAEVEIEEADE